MSANIYGLLITLCVFTTLDSARILLMPFIQGSHAYWMSELGRNLISRGHQCYAIAGYKEQQSLMTNAGIQLLRYKLSHNEDKEILLKEQMSNFSHLGIEGKLDVISQIKSVEETGYSFMQDGIQLLKNNSNLLQEIKQLNFDIAILDGIFFTNYNYIIPYKLDIPYVTITSLWFPHMNGIPAPLSLATYQMFKHSDKMVFQERLYQLLFELLFSYKYPAPGDFLVPEVVPNKPHLTLQELQRRSDLFILDLAPPVNYPTPSLPHVSFVSGLTIKPAKKIVDLDLQNFVDSTMNGFILISFGSYVPDLPPAMFQKLLDLVRSVPQKVIWKHKQITIDNLPDNLKLLSWLPQNDLLGHPNCKLFITHCGNNGQNEALYHGIPMLGFPFYGDQGYNCHRLPSLGYGLYMDVANFTSDDLIKNTKEILNNLKYAKKAKLASDILNDDPNFPVEKASYWIEHVIKFGSEHLKSPAIHMPRYQLWMFDLFFTLLIIIIIILFILIIACKCMWRSLKWVVKRDETN